MELIANTVGQLKIEPAQSHLNLAMFPLIGESAMTGYVLLDDAVDKGLVRVAEVSEAGRVPELKLENQSDESVLLVDGDELIGARQNRILNITLLVPARASIPIPVSCVERGRWSYVSRHFRPANRTLFAKARASKMAQVSASMRQSGRRASDQVALWGEISGKFASLSAASDTEAMGDLYMHERFTLAAFQDEFRARPAQVGAVFAINGVPAGLEIFDAASTFERFLPKLIGSFAMDAIEAPSPAADVPSIEEVAAFLSSIQRAAAETFAALGEGQDVRLHGEGLAGAALVARERIVHLAAFPQETA